MSKTKKFILAFVVAAMGLLCFVIFLNVNNSSGKIIITNVEYVDNTFEIKLNNIKNDSYCAVIEGNVDDSFVNSEFVEIDSNNICKYKVVDYGNYYVYIKHDDNIQQINVDDQSFKLDVENNDIYLAKGDTSELYYNVINLGNGSIDISVSDDNIVSVTDNLIKAENIGETEINISIGDSFQNVKVIVTDLIDIMPKQYNYDRDYLSCNVFSSEEESLLDAILEDRVEEAGFKTRAGVVAAARFLTLEFPYRISYFSENGRLTNYNGEKLVDGEGRYYHKGLYLTSSKFSDIQYVDQGPNPWGCTIYSRPSGGNRANGLDCSGFTTWALLNGGFDVEDLGAYGGGSSGYDLNDIGIEADLTSELVLSDRIKAGDLLGEVTVTEGHSALIVGIDEDNYYVAESLWIQPLGLNINTYKKSELINYFETVNLMDEYYENDGNYTEMWY